MTANTTMLVLAEVVTVWDVVFAFIGGPLLLLALAVVFGIPIGIYICIVEAIEHYFEQRGSREVSRMDAIDPQAIRRIRDWLHGVDNFLLLSSSLIPPLRLNPDGSLSVGSQPIHLPTFMLTSDGSLQETSQ